MATRVAAAGGGDWNTGSSWVGGVAPTAADDAQITAASGNMSIGSGAVCRSADFSTYTGTLSGTGTLTIGDATAGLSNIALKLVAGMTVSGPPAFTFISTSATVQTVDFAGKTTGNVTFNATSNGSWQYTGGHTVGAAVVVTLTKGTLNLNGQTVNWGLFNSSNSNTRTLTTGAATINITGVSNTAWETGTTTGFTLNTTGSVINISGGSGAGLSCGGKTLETVRMTGSGFNVISGSATFGTFERTGTAATDCVLSLSGSFTVTTELKLGGNSAINRLSVVSNTKGTTRTFTNTGATMTWANVDFEDIAITTPFDASAITGNSGDCGGNSGITFTTAATQTWSGTSGGNWNTNAWTTRVPLPQDDAVISSAFAASQTITANTPRLCKSLSFTGATGTPNFASGGTIYGSLTLISGMTLAAVTMTFAGRSNYTITSAGKQFPNTVSIVAPGGTYTLQDALSTASNFFITSGSFVSGSFNITCLAVSSNNSNTRSITLGTSSISVTSTATSTPWNTSTVTGLTLSGASATVNISNASANVRTIAPGGLTIGTLTYTVAGSTGSLSIQGSNTFGTINFSDATNARSLLFGAGTTTTIISSFNVQGTAGKLMTVSSLTAATHTLSKASGVVDGRYLNISYSIATGGAQWYAGVTSTNGGNNTGWIFTDAPVTGGSSGSGAGNLNGILNLDQLGMNKILQFFSNLNFFPPIFTQCLV